MLAPLGGNFGLQPFATSRELAPLATLKVSWAGICTANGGYNLAMEDLGFGEFVPPMLDSDGSVYIVSDQENGRKEQRMLEELSPNLLHCEVVPIRSKFALYSKANGVFLVMFDSEKDADRTVVGGP